MALTKRLRYEILRRDNHACRYCGATAPDAKLVVDHVLPQALGGSDDPSNLVAACQPCNSGKSASTPDAPIVADVEADALRWAAAAVRVADVHRAIWQDEDDFLDTFAAHWDSWQVNGVPAVERPAGWDQSILSFRRAGLDQYDLEHSTRVAMSAKHIPHGRVFRYFCGVAWRIIEDRRNATAALLQSEEAPADGS